MPILELVREHRILAAMRGVPAEKAADVAEALFEGGVRLLEITFDQKNPKRLADTAGAVESVVKRMENRMAVGTGTVMAPEEAEAACGAGASFIVAPNTDAKVIERAKALGAGVIPGAFTPTEIALAYSCGADIVKVFPAGDLGIDYLRAVKAPLGHIPLLAMGGVNISNLRDFLTVADGVGIGSNIVNFELIRENRFKELSALARAYVDLIK